MRRRERSSGIGQSYEPRITRSARVPFAVVAATPSPATTDELPRLTPTLARDAETMCGLRLAKSFAGLYGQRSSTMRFRLRQQIVEQARVAHATLCAPTPEAFAPVGELFPEERALFARAATGYAERFADAPARTCDLEVSETHDEARGVRLTGGIDLLLEDAQGRLELRVLTMGRGAPPTPDQDPGVRYAAARLRTLTDAPRVRWRHADLWTGVRTDVELDLVALAPLLDGWLDDILRTVRARAASATPRQGRECGWCPYVPHCPAVK